MCGIVGYVGHRDAADFLLQGLRRLEYRGYDSAGIATLPEQGDIQVVKTAGRIDALAERMEQASLGGRVGIGHTRWATHGPPPRRTHIHTLAAPVPWWWCTTV